MNLELLKKLLAEASPAAWEIVDEKIRGWEFYFIRHKLDQARSKEVENLLLKLYMAPESKETIGMASCLILPTESEVEVRQKIEDLKKRALLVQNPYYTLRSDDGIPKEDLKMVAVDAISDTFIRTMTDLEETETEDINSYEIFANEVHRHVLNSEGVDITEIYPDSMLEVVVNARSDDGHEIEIYRNLTSGTANPEAIKKEIAKAMTFGRDKLRAVKTPSLGQYPVILSTSAVTSVFNYFFSQVDASMKYRGLSAAELGKPLTEGVAGDKVTMLAVRKLPNSSRNFGTDSEGAIIRERMLIRDNVPESFHGTRQYSEYLGLGESSIVYNYAVKPGNKPACELRQGAYIEVVEFSDFQVDSMTGDIAGEIRLGYLHDGENVTIVSGSSVSGNLREAMKHMTFSREAVQYDTCLVPEVVRFESLTIS